MRKKTDNQRINILLIEDNPDHAELVREMLVEAKSALFNMECAERLSTAITRLSEEKFDLVLSDLSLPDSLGLETFYKLHTQAPNIPVVVLSVLDDKEIAVKAVHAGAQDYLVKGQVDGKLLERSIFYAIERKHIEKVLGEAHEELEMKVKQRTADLARTNEELQIEVNERKQAQDTLLRRNQIQNLFNEMLSISLQPYDLDEIFDRILDRIVSIPWLTYQSKGSILMVEDNPGELVTKTFREFSEKQQTMCSQVPFGRCLCGLAVSTKQVQFTSSLDDDRHENTYEGITPHGHYCIPILSSDRALGVLNLYVKEGHPHSKEEEDYLCAIANGLAGIIERKRTEEELTKHRLHLEELVKERTTKLTDTNKQLMQEITVRKLAEEKTSQSYHIQSVINSILQISLEPIQLEEQLNRVLDITLSIPWLNLQSRGAIFLVEDNPEMLTMKVQRGLSNPHENACQEIHFGECLCGRAASKSEIQFSSCHNSCSNARYPDIDPHSHYCIPILFEESVIGVMVLYSDVGHKRNREEEKTLLSIANALAGIIQRKRAEEALSESENQFRSLFENMTEGVALHRLIYDEDGTPVDYMIIDVNPAYGYHTDIIPQDAICKKASELYGTEKPPYFDVFADVATTGQPKVFETYFEPMQKHFSISVCSPSKGKFATVFEDITEQKNADKALKVKQEEIKNLNKNLAKRVQEEVKKSRQKDFIMMHQSRLAAMGEMIGNIAHQWKQPLNALIFLLYNIKDHYESNELTEETLDKLVVNGDKLIRKMSDTIDDFRSFFKPNKKKELFNVNKTIKNSLSLVDASLRFNNITVTLNEEEDIMVWGFANEYSQVILNILNNAKDAIIARGVDGKITIDIFHKDNFNILKIKDNGGGIPEKIKHRVFDPYFTTKEEGKGTGIGLYMSKVIIEEHMDGHLDAHNENGGAELSITTPIIHPDHKTSF